MVNGSNGSALPPLPSVSVIVVGYNSRSYLDACFAALVRQRYAGEVEVLFVDNASRDGSADYVAGAFPGVRVVETGANLGYAGGNNFGAARARGSVLVFLNPDTEVAPGWLAALVRPLVADPTIGLTTSKVLMMHQRATINTCGNDVSLAGIAWCRGLGQPASAYAEDADVPAVSGSAFATLADLFRRLGGFDERFFMYLEDTDLSWRARVAGYRCRYVADSVVYHDYRLGFSPWKLGLIERNRYRMLGKHLSLRGIVALSPALAAAEVVTWGYAALRGPKCLLAKAHATAWALTQLGPVVRTRWRPVEGEILRQHRPTPPVIAGLGGPLSRGAQRVVGAGSRVLAAVSLRLLPTARVRWRPSGALGWTEVEPGREGRTPEPDETVLVAAGHSSKRTL